MKVVCHDKRKKERKRNGGGGIINCLLTKSQHRLGDTGKYFALCHAASLPYFMTKTYFPNRFPYSVNNYIIVNCNAQDQRKSSSQNPRPLEPNFDTNIVTPPNILLCDINRVW